ncbi:MAG: hypothetical protein U5O69_06340 [Candidatus Competibacteraceae bacterium]|nr:hypothetical protein [Candidatus Competibacteraceae bacterium]
MALAKPISRSVSPLMAETTTTTWLPRSRQPMTFSATLSIRSMLPTEVPPYFCTISAIGYSESKGIEQIRSPRAWRQPIFE